MRWGEDLRLSFRAGRRSFDDRNNRRSGKLAVNFLLVFRVSITGEGFFFFDMARDPGRAEEKNKKTGPMLCPLG